MLVRLMPHGPARSYDALAASTKALFSPHRPAPSKTRATERAPTRPSLRRGEELGRDLHVSITQ